GPGIAITHRLGPPRARSFTVVLVASGPFLKARRGASHVTAMTSRDGAEAAWATPPSPANEAHRDGGASLHAQNHVGPRMPESNVSLPVDLPTMLRQIENAYINAALTQTRCNKKEAAKLLGMGRTTLVEKLRRRNARDAA